MIDIQSQDPTKGTFTVTVVPNQMIPATTAIAQAYYECTACDPKRILYITSLAGASASLLAKNTEDITMTTRGIFDGDYESTDMVAILNGKFTRLL